MINGRFQRVSVFLCSFFIKRTKKSSALERSATKRTGCAPIVTKEMAGKPCHALIDGDAIVVVGEDVSLWLCVGIKMNSRLHGLG